jgi:hypothetical protein
MFVGSFLTFFSFGDTLIASNKMLFRVMLGFISDQSEMNLLFKTEYTVTIGQYIYCLAYDWMVKDGWKVTWHDSKQDVVRCYCASFLLQSLDLIIGFVWGPNWMFFCMQGLLQNGNIVANLCIVTIWLKLCRVRVMVFNATF